MRKLGTVLVRRLLLQVFDVGERRVEIAGDGPFD